MTADLSISSLKARLEISPSVVLTMATGKYFVLCKECSYTTKSKSHLRRHAKSVHGDAKPHKCDECPFATSHNRDLQVHIKETHRKSLPCEKCPHIASNKGNLQMHIDAIHMKLKSFKTNKT